MAQANRTEFGAKMTNPVLVVTAKASYSSRRSSKVLQLYLYWIALSVVEFTC